MESFMPFHPFKDFTPVNLYDIVQFNMKHGNVLPSELKGQKLLSKVQIVGTISDIVVDNYFIRLNLTTSSVKNFIVILSKFAENMSLKIGDHVVCTGTLTLRKALTSTYDEQSRTWKSFNQIELNCSKNANFDKGKVYDKAAYLQLAKLIVNIYDYERMYPSIYDRSLLPLGPSFNDGPTRNTVLSSNSSTNEENKVDQDSVQPLKDSVDTSATEKHETITGSDNVLTDFTLLSSDNTSYHMESSEESPMKRRKLE